MKIFFLLLFTLISCNKENNEDDIPDSGAFSVFKNIVYNEISVDVVIDKPGNNEVGVLMVYHGTVGFDNKIVEAAYKTLRGFKRILDSTDMMIVSVAYTEAYYERSLLNFTNEFKSDILFVQGLNDAPIQMYSWPVFKEQVNACGQCRDVHFLEIPGFGHRALFESTHARKIFNDFLSSR